MYVKVMAHINKFINLPKQINVFFKVIISLTEFVNHIISEKLYLLYRETFLESLWKSRRL